MVVRIPVIPTAIAALVGVAAVAWFMTRPAPDPDVQRHGMEAGDLTVQDKQTLRLVTGAVSMLAQMRKDGSDLGFGREVAEVARFHLMVLPHGFRDDCSGFVSAVFTNSGVEMDGVVASIYDLAVVHDVLHWRPVPAVGDVVFFDNTHDRNGNDEWDDMNTHIGIILEVDPDGTATFAHSGTSKGRSTGRINIARSGEYKDKQGNILNSYLRSPEAWDKPTATYLTGELWAGFATIEAGQDWHTDPPPPESWP